MDEVKVLGKDEHLALLPILVAEEVSNQVESPETDKTSVRDEHTNVAILTTSTIQKYPTTLHKRSVESTMDINDSINRRKETEEDHTEHKDEHLPLEPTLVAGHEESSQIEFHDARNKTIDIEEAQIDLDESNTTPSCIDRMCCFSKCACLLSCFLVISHFMETHSTLGEIAFKIFGLVMYSIDVVTDFVSGASFISGPKIDYEKFGNTSFTNYTEGICNELVDYSHPIWGALNIAVAWLPGVTLAPPLIFHWNKTGNEFKINWAQKVLILMSLVAFWPFIGLLL